MTILTAVTDILNRAGLDYESPWSTRGLYQLLNAINRLIAERKYSKFDFPGLLAYEELTIASDGIVTYLGNNNDFTDTPEIMEITGVFADPETSQVLVFTEIPISEVANIASNSNFSPDSSEVYYYFSGQNIRFYPKSVAEAKYVTVEYIKAHDLTIATDTGTELVNLYFSSAFVATAIELAYEAMLKELNI